MTQWVVENLGPDVPMHFTAFHPDYRMRDKPRTPPIPCSGHGASHARMVFTMLPVISTTRRRAAPIAMDAACD